VSYPPWLARELEPNRKLFPDNLPSILYGALVGGIRLVLGTATFFLISIRSNCGVLFSRVQTSVGPTYCLG